MKGTLQDIINNHSESNIKWYEESYEEKEGYTIFGITGGLNGLGEWDDYFSSLGRLVEKIKESFSDVWVIELKNDCPDDVFYCTFGTRK